MLIGQLQARVEKAEAAARQIMKKLKAREKSDSTRLLNESLARRCEERLARHIDATPARQIDTDAPVNRLVNNSLVQRCEREAISNAEYELSTWTASQLNQGPPLVQLTL